MKGNKGSTVRIVLAKGFIQPVAPYDNKLESQLRALLKKPFPANNAVEFQFADITLTGEAIDVSSEFDFSEIKNQDFKADGSKPFSIDEDHVPLGIVAAVVDPKNDHLPLGPVTAPIISSLSDRVSFKLSAAVAGNLFQ